MGATIENAYILMPQYRKKPHRPRRALTGLVVINHHRPVGAHAARTEQHTEDRKKRIQWCFGRIVEADAIDIDMRAAGDVTDGEVLSGTEIHQRDVRQAGNQLRNSNQITTILKAIFIHKTNLIAIPKIFLNYLTASSLSTPPSRSSVSK